MIMTAAQNVSAVVIILSNGPSRAKCNNNQLIDYLLT
jgi:hypothetical protein